MREKRNINLWKRGKLAVGLLLFSITASGFISYLPAHALVDEDYVAPDGTTIVQVEDMTIAPGVKEQEIITLDSNWKRVNNFAVEVNLKDYPSAQIVVGNWHDTTNYNLAYLSRQVYYAQQNGKRVVAGFNGDFFNTSTGEPQGCFVKDGIEVKTLGDGKKFFGIKEDGSAVIGDDLLYQSLSQG